MIYRTLGKSDLRVSVVGLGTWAMGNDFWGVSDDLESVRAIHAALDNGINLVDTAPVYGSGHSEEIVGKAIKGKRDEVVLATKVGIKKAGKGVYITLKPESIRQEIDDSLRRLGTDYIDLYQIHRPDPDTPLEESLNELVKLRDMGKFRYLGVSNFSRELLDKTLKTTWIVSDQPHYSMLEREIEKDILPFCLEKNIGILGYGTLGGGILTGRYKVKPEFEKGDYRDRFYDFYSEPTWSKVLKLLNILDDIASYYQHPVSNIVIAWTFHQMGITSALTGARKTEQVISNARAGNLMLKETDLKMIRDALLF